MTARAQVGDYYRSSRARLTDLLAGLDPDDWSAPVPACPGWDVRDVVAHLVGVIEDSNEGRLDGPPPPAQTAEEVARHRDEDTSALLGRWEELAPPFEELISAVSIWPAFFDVLSHEHDVHGALGSTGLQGHADVALAAKLLVRGADLGRPFVVDTGTDQLTSAVREGDPLVLRTSAFEAFRLRLGRRSRSQVLALDWSEDPGDLVDRLFVFGPAEVDLTE